MHYIVKETDIFTGEIFEFQSAEEGIVNIIEKGRKKIIFYNGIFLDFFGNVLTKVNFYAVNEQFTALDIEVRAMTPYVDEIRICEDVNEQDLFYAINAIEYYEYKKSLLEEGKIIVFPNKILY